jgi:hypothetical protein
MMCGLISGVDKSGWDRNAYLTKLSRSSNLLFQIIQSNTVVLQVCTVLLSTATAQIGRRRATCWNAAYQGLEVVLGDHVSLLIKRDASTDMLYRVVLVA